MTNIGATYRLSLMKERLKAAEFGDMPNGPEAFAPAPPLGAQAQPGPAPSVTPPSPPAAAPGIMDAIKNYLDQAGQFAQDHPLAVGAGVAGGGLGAMALHNYLNQPEDDEEDLEKLGSKGAANRPAFFVPSRD